MGFTNLNQPFSDLSTLAARAAAAVAAAAQMSQDQAQALPPNHHHINGAQSMPEHPAEGESSASPSTSASSLATGVATSGAMAAGPEMEPRVPGSTATVEEPLPAG